MPAGTPKIGDYESKPTVLGTIKPSVVDPPPAQTTNTWVDPEEGVTISVTEPPPPWELPGTGEQADSDARRFADVPENWTLRWINPRVLTHSGWRDWQPVLANDPRVNVRVRTLIAPDNLVRRGGQDGDILAWMYTSWVVSRHKLMEERTKRQTQSAVERQEQLKEEFKGGKYGPHMHLEHAAHPTHTMGDGRSMKDA